MSQTQTVGPDPVALAAELRPLLARNAAQAERDRRLPMGLTDQVDMNALQKAVVDKTGVPTFVGKNEEASTSS